MFQDQIKTIQNAASIVFAQRKYRGIGVTMFIVFLALYLLTLPATYTGGRVGMVSLQYLTPVLAVFSFVMAGLIAVIFSFMAYTLEIGESSSTAATTSGFLGSVLPPLLCCSPLLPIIAASVAGIFPAAFGVSGFIQGFVATYEIEILTAATLTLLYATLRNAQSVTRCSL